MSNRQTRMLIAHLYVRYRNAREGSKRLSRSLGNDSITYLQARSAEFEAWNAYQSSKCVTNLETSSRDPRQMLRVVAMRGKHANRLQKVA